MTVAQLGPEGGKGHKNHPLNQLVHFSLGLYPDMKKERDFRGVLAPLRRYHDRMLNPREQRFVLHFILSRCDPLDAARRAEVLPWPAEDGGDVRWDGKRDIDYSDAATRLLSLTHVYIIIKDLIRLTGLDRPDRSYLRAMAFGVAQRAAASNVREANVALQILLKLCPELMTDEDTVGDAKKLELATKAVEKSIRAGFVRRTGEVGMPPFKPLPAPNGETGVETGEDDAPERDVAPA